MASSHEIHENLNPSKLNTLTVYVRSRHFYSHTHVATYTLKLRRADKHNAYSYSYTGCKYTCACTVIGSNQEYTGSYKAAYACVLLYNTMYIVHNCYNIA